MALVRLLLNAPDRLVYRSSFLHKVLVHSPTSGRRCISRRSVSKLYLFANNGPIFNHEIDIILNLYFRSHMSSEYIFTYIYIVTKSSQNSLNVFPFLFDESVTQDGNQSIQGAPKCRSKVSSFHEKPTRDSILRIKTNVTFSSIFFSTTITCKNVKRIHFFSKS